MSDIDMSDNKLPPPRVGQNDFCPTLGGGRLFSDFPRHKGGFCLEVWIGIKVLGLSGNLSMFDGPPQMSLLWFCSSNRSSSLKL